MKPNVSPVAQNFSPRRKLRVLLVEDNDFNRKYVASLLNATGFDVVQVANGALALDALETASKIVDVVVLDVNMPVMDGLTATKRIREQFPALPVIALTSGSRVGKEECLAAGCDRYLQKPVRKEQLRDTIISLLVECEERGVIEERMMCIVLTNIEEVSNQLRVLLGQLYSNVCVSVSKSVSEAVEMIALWNFDMVVIDLDAPVDWLGVVEESRSVEFSHPPVIIGISERDGDTQNPHLFDAMVTKPVTKEFLLPFIQRSVRAAKLVGLCVCNAQGTILRPNLTFCQMVGYSIPQIRGKNLSVILQEVDEHQLNAEGMEIFFRVGQRLLSGGTNVYRKACRSDGSGFSVSVSVVKAGEGFNVVFEEVNAGAVSLNVDEDGVIQMVKGPSYRVLGCHCSQVTGKKLRDYAISDERCVTAMKSGHSVVYFQNQVESARIACVMTVLPSSDGKHYEVSLSRIADHAEAVVRFTKGTIVDCNKEFEQLIGKPKSSLVGKSVDNVLELQDSQLPRNEPKTLRVKCEGGILVHVTGLFRNVEDEVIEAVLSSRSNIFQTVPPEVGLYRLGKLLGSGHLGRVWQATHSQTHASVVVKHLRRENFVVMNVRQFPTSFPACFINVGS
jgi:PAS domain S-box-containing protein